MAGFSSFLWLNNIPLCTYTTSSLSIHLCCAVLSLSLCNPMDSSLPGSSVHGDSPGKNTGVGCHAFLQGIFPTRDQPRSPALQLDSVPSELPGKPKNTGVGSLSLLQQVFLIQELNRSLLHHRQILYHLSYQGSPRLHHSRVDALITCINQDQD